MWPEIEFIYTRKVAGSLRELKDSKAGLGPWVARIPFARPTDFMIERMSGTARDIREGNMANKQTRSLRKRGLSLRFNKGVDFSKERSGPC